MAKAKKPAKRPKKAKQAKKRYSYRTRTPKPPKSLDECVVWRPHFAEPGHETFQPALVPLRLLPWDVRDYYTRKEVDLDFAMCYPGPKRQIYGRALKPLVYFVVQRKDGMKDAWAKLPNPSLRDMPTYWQIDKNIRWYQPWKW